jgi:hypothetical protein
MTTKFNLKAGSKIMRKELHETYGGQVQGGISTPSNCDSIFLFTAPVGTEFGYTDGWAEGRKAFFYTGEGKRGNQSFTRGNKAIFETLKQNKKSIYLFDGARGEVQLIGRFHLSQSEPFRISESHDVEGDVRNIIVFNLIPISQRVKNTLGVEQYESVFDSNAPQCTEIDIESSEAETFIRRATTQSVASRTEAKLTKSFIKYLTEEKKISKKSIIRNKIKIPGSSHVLFTDIFIKNLKLLIEAKSYATRESIRTAIGQLLDYKRFIEHDAIAILIPQAPSRDLINLINENGISVIYKEGSDFIIKGTMDL